MKKKEECFFGIIGDPVEHSLSPFMQNAAFQKKKLPFEYRRFQLSQSELPVFLKKKDWKGLNVTIPHKEAVLAFIDKLHPKAKKIGAANTLLLQKNKIYGFNTDGDGYLLSLKKEKRFNPKGKQALILGAGGAARAILAALAESKIKRIYLTNRNPEKAEALVKEFSKKFKETQFLAVKWEGEAFTTLVPQIQLLVQSTSLGLKGEKIPFPWTLLNKKCLVSDLIYLPTPFLKEAKKRGFSTLSGLGMLLYQGVLAFEIWTGRKAPVLTMKKALDLALKKHKKAKK